MIKQHMDNKHQRLVIKQTVYEVIVIGEIFTKLQLN